MVGYNQRYFAAYKKFQEAQWGKPIYAESKWSETSIRVAIHTKTIETLMLLDLT